jgi:hypothetical protein
MRRWVWPLCIVLLTNSCIDLSRFTNQVKDTTTQTVDALDQGISTLADVSADWQATLQDVAAKLPKEAQEFVRTEISNTISRGIAAAGAEFRCNVDFLRTRARDVLLRLRARILGGNYPEPEPALCSVVPLGVDLALDASRRNLLEYYGYDFDNYSLQALLVNSSGTIDVSTKLDRPTPYHMTLNLGANGVQLGAASQHLLLKWKDREISSVAVIQPATAVCESRVLSVPGLNPVTFVPPRTNGDAEFAGNGPDVSVRVDVIKTPSIVSARVSMSAVELGGDHTTASGFQDFVLYRAEPGEVVDAILSGTYDFLSYRDSNTTIDSFGRPSGGPTLRYEVTGDTDGDEAGTRTQVVVSFNALRLALRKNTQCVPPVAAVTLQAQARLAPATVLRLTPAIGLVHPEIRNLARP